MAHAVQSIASNCSELWPRALQRATLSELNHTLAQSSAVLGGTVGVALHAEIIHIFKQTTCLHRSVPMSHITIVCIPMSCGEPLFLSVGGIDQPTDKLYLHKISLTQRSGDEYSVFPFHRSTLVATLSSLLANLHKVRRSVGEAIGYQI